MAKWFKYHRGSSKRPSRAVGESAEVSPSSSVRFRSGRTLSSARAGSFALVDGSNSGREKLRQLTRRRQQAARLIVVITSLAIFSILLIWQLIFNLEFKLVLASGAEVAKFDQQRYARALNDYFKEQPMERLGFVLNQDRLKNFLQQNTPEIELIKQIKTSFLQPTLFVLQSRQPVAIWQTQAQQSERQYVDANGVIFDHNYASSDGLVVITNQLLEVKSEDRPAASRRFLRFVGQFIALAEEKSCRVDQVILPSTSIRQVQATCKDQPGFVKLSLDYSPARQAEDMARARQFLSNRGIIPEYIDARVGGVAFYK